MFVKCRGGSQLPAFNFVNGWDIVPRLLDDTGIASIVEVCCAVLCCAVLCCAVLCCAVLCQPCHATFAAFRTISATSILPFMLSAPLMDYV